MAVKAAASALFAEHEKPTHCCRKTLCDGLAPVDRIVADTRRQMMEYQLLIGRLEAALDADDPADGLTEHFHQTIGAVEREAQALLQASRNLQKARRQMDAYITTAKADMAAKGMVEAGEVPSVQ